MTLLVPIPPRHTTDPPLALSLTAVTYTLGKPASRMSKRSGEPSSVGSDDWDVMGDDGVDAQAVVHVPGDSRMLGGGLAPMPPFLEAEISEQLERRRSMKRCSDRANDLNRVPRFATGEPQFAYGDGGGIPAVPDARFCEVLNLRECSRALESDSGSYSYSESYSETDTGASSRYSDGVRTLLRFSL